MSRTTWRWLYALAVFFVAGPACWWLVHSVPAGDGSPAAGATLSANPMLSLVNLLAAAAIAAGAGAIGARLFSQRSGLVCAGLALFWTPWATARLDELARQPIDRAIFPALALDGAIAGVLSVAIAAAVWAARPRSAPRGTVPPEGLLSMGWTGPATGIAVGAVAAWCFARSYDPGQGFAAALAAGLFGCLVGRVVDHRSPGRAYFLIPLALAVISPLVAWASGSRPAIDAIYAGDVFPPATIMPVHWLAGSLLGIPLGSAWAASMIEKRVGEGH